MQIFNATRVHVRRRQPEILQRIDEHDKQLFEYEARIADLEKRRMLDLKKIRKLGKENDDLKDKNQKLMERKYPPANSRAPKPSTSSRPPLPTRASSS